MLNTECYEEKLRKLKIVIDYLDTKINDLKTETRLEFRTSKQNEKIAKYTAELNICKKAYDVLTYDSKFQDKCPIHSSTQNVIPNLGAT